MVSHQTGDPETKGLWRKRFDDNKNELRLFGNKKFVHFLGIYFQSAFRQSLK
jgi:hypothetical protein